MRKISEHTGLTFLFNSHFYDKWLEGFQLVAFDTILEAFFYNTGTMLKHQALPKSKNRKEKICISSTPAERAD